MYTFSVFKISKPVLKYQKLKKKHIFRVKANKMHCHPDIYNESYSHKKFVFRYIVKKQCILFFSSQNLTGPDPPSIRPQWLYVTSKVKTKPLVARTVRVEVVE